VEWGIAPERSYSDIATLIASEAARPDGVQAIAIATPNNSHAAIAASALAAGLHVLCEKPMTATLEEAHALAALARQSPARFALTYTYAGYAMVREARARIASGEIGAVRKVMVDYQQGWLTEPIDTDNAQAWRTDPASAGSGGCIGDIGVHAFHLAEHVSGLRVRDLCADLSGIVPGRRLDDDCNVLLRFDGGVLGVLTASQVATGEGNAACGGETGAFSWSHHEPGLLQPSRRWSYRDDLCRNLSGGGPHGPRQPPSLAIPKGSSRLSHPLQRFLPTPSRVRPTGSAPLFPVSRTACARCSSSKPPSCRAAPAHGASVGDRAMKTIKGPAIFLAQFMGDRPRSTRSTIWPHGPQTWHEAVQVLAPRL
jgi:predicted dehydrogenase